MRKQVKLWIRRRPMLQLGVRGAQRSRLLRTKLHPLALAWVSRERKRFRLPEQLDIELTNLCNFSCRICPHSSMTREQGIMSSELYTLILSRAKNAGIKCVNLNNIGEPLLDPALIERIKEAKSAGLRVSLHSNGALLNPELTSKLLTSRVDHLNFSIGNSVSKKAVSNIDALLQAKRDPFVSVTLVRTAENVEQIKGFFQHYCSIADDVILRDARTWAGTVELCSSDSRDSSEKLPLAPCKHLWWRMVVLHDGRVPLCAIDFEGQEIIGDLRSQSVQELWQAGPINRVRALHLAGERREHRICSRCNVRESWF